MNSNRVAWLDPDVFVNVFILYEKVRVNHKLLQCGYHHYLNVF
jgi:hypothetical protein